MNNEIAAICLALMQSSSAVHAASQPGTVPAETSIEATRQELDEFLLAKVASGRFSGSVLVAKDGQVLLSKGYGYANVELGVPNTTKTKFRLGSITKQFTATLVMQLRERNLLALQDSLCKYLSPCPEAWKPVTLHHLLSHTSGISGYGDPPTDTAVIPPWTAEHIARRFRDTPLEFPPGTQSKYSDWAYCLLGMVIERVTGEHYEQVLQESIFAPLGMKDSGYDHSESIVQNRAAGYHLEAARLENAPYINMAGPYSAGALYSTVEDLYKWDQALYGSAVLPAPALQLMWTPFLGGYGYGWLVSDPGASSDPVPFWAVPGKYEVAHPGEINGFSAEIQRFPRDRAVVIVLSNIDNLPKMVGSSLARMLFGEKIEPKGD